MIKKTLSITNTPQIITLKSTWYKLNTFYKNNKEMLPIAILERKLSFLERNIKLPIIEITTWDLFQENDQSTEFV